MGLITKSRGNANIVKKIYNELLNDVLNMKNYDTIKK